MLSELLSSSDTLIYMLQRFAIQAKRIALLQQEVAPISYDSLHFKSFQKELVMINEWIPIAATEFIAPKFLLIESLKKIRARLHERIAQSHQWVEDP